MSWYAGPVPKIGDLVREPDGRHVGRLVAIRGANGSPALTHEYVVRWLDTGWTSHLSPDQVELA